jgi:hypothetical protein
LLVAQVPSRLKIMKGYVQSFLGKTEVVGLGEISKGDLPDMYAADVDRTM